MTGACLAHDKSVSSGLDNLLFCRDPSFCHSCLSCLAAAELRAECRVVGVRSAQTGIELNMKPKHVEILGGLLMVARSGRVL